MKIKLAGGVGEYGRSAFLISDNHNTLLLDAGIMKGNGILESQRYPVLTKEEIQEVTSVFITHSHEDHCGAVPFLIEKGFNGKIYSTEETQSQIRAQQLLPEPIMESQWQILSMDNGQQQMALGNRLTIQWGMNGHMPGSVWYMLTGKKHRIFYSGDFSPESSLMAYQKPISRRTDLVIVDAAYGEDCQEQADLIGKMFAAMEQCLKKGGKVLIPVPGQGRGLDLLALFVNRNYYWKVPLLVEEKIARAFEACQNKEEWLHSKGKKLLRTFLQEKEIMTRFTEKQQLENSWKEGILLVDGAMMESPLAQHFYNQMQEKDLVILNGNQAANTMGSRLLKELRTSGRPETIQIRYNVHMDEKRALQLAECLRAKKKIPFHSKQPLSEGKGWENRKPGDVIHL